MTDNCNTALVTGTSSGIGAAVAKQLLERGWSVIGISRRDPPIEHAHYEHLYVDLADHAALSRAVERSVGPHLRDSTLDRFALVNNAAAIGQLRPIEHLDARGLAELYVVNVVAPVWLMGFVSRHARTDAALRIVNVSSNAGVQAFPGLAAYGSSKAALRMAGMVLAEEWASAARGAPTRRDASILSFGPGVVDTPMQTAARGEPADTFPWVSSFQHFAESGMLVPPEVPASEIVAFLESDGQPAFAERPRLTR